MKYPKQLKLTFCIKGKSQQTRFENFWIKQEKIEVQRSENYRGGITYNYQSCSKWNDEVVVIMRREDDQ